ncbi:alpha/beta hydrolase family protein [Aquisphaera insulae]|uniref:alpha/beta hydrolase family protein n=1 Tax=Aquisphaera insulae TaxID=2712864 RepID=UPI0013EA5E1A|nr:acetylxylan esterase [Aquisphaera insulae]
MTQSMSRRTVLGLGLSAAFGPGLGGFADAPVPDLHQQLLALAATQEARRRARFEAISTPTQLDGLKASLRASFLEMLGGMPGAQGPPAARITGRISGDGYTVDRVLFESFPGFQVSGLVYRPAGDATAHPGVLSPCGHSEVGKAHETYQTLHINLAKRGFVVLTYDPVGQGERSQFWDASRGRSRFDLSCGEHCVLGNPLYLLGMSFARYRIWDAIRALDYLISLPGVDAARIGCVGNSGGGNLTAYLAAVDDRVRVPVIGCYITALPRRMANRIQEDPSSDPEQDPHGFVSRGIDHAGLLALIAPRPALLCSAEKDFFPIAGTRATFAEAKRLYAIAGAEDRIGMTVAPGPHGLSRPLREAAYAWFDHWLKGKPRDAQAPEVAVSPRDPAELRASPDGQVNGATRSRPFLPMAWEQYRNRPPRPRVELKTLLRSDAGEIDFRLHDEAAGTREGRHLVLLVNGNEAPAWGKERALIDALAAGAHAVTSIDPRGVGSLRVPLKSRGDRYEDPLSGVEENLAYNAFLVGESLVAMRVADVLAAVARLSPANGRPGRPIVLCGRRDSALVVLLAAAIEPRITSVAIEDGLLSFMPLFAPEGLAINAASLLPGLLRDFGDLPDVLAALSPRPVLAAACRGSLGRELPAVRTVEDAFTAKPATLIEWLGAGG